MEIATTLRRWNEEHQAIWAFPLRVILGLVLVSQTLYYGQNQELFFQMIANSRFYLYSNVLFHYTMLVHIAGGILIMLGMITRISVLFQLPVIIGAIFFADMERGFFSGYGERLLAIAVFIGLAFFFYYGPGPYSIDNYLRKHGNV